MEDAAAGWAVVAQCVMAGFIVALLFQHVATWRGDRGDKGAAWMIAWTGALAGLFLVNALMPTRSGAVTEAGMFLRSQLVAASLLLAVPAVRIIANGRPARRFVVAASAMMIARAALWLGTDVVYAHEFVAGLPQYGPLWQATLLPPLGVVGWYTAVSLLKMPTGALRSAVSAAGILSAGTLVVALLIPGGRIAELLMSVWAAPLVVALHTMKALKVSSSEQHMRRQHGMRDALATIGNDSWFTKDRLGLLKLAQAAAREQLNDPSIVGTMRPLSRGRFATEFHSVKGLQPDDLSRGFLDDLCRIVSVAAARTQLAEELREAAFTDSLTQLPNRRALERHLAQVLGRAGEDGTQVGVLYCDINGFKAGNDLHGHAWGDHLLRRTGQSLRAHAGPNGYVARFGGDEFVVVLEDARTLGDLIELAKLIHFGPDLESPDQLSPVLCVGVATWSPGDDANAEQLLRQADTAMFEGKRQPGGVVVFDDALRAHMLSEQSLNRELEAALVLDEFELHYQPIVDSATLEVVSVEALVRWQHPDGVRMPGQWIDYAEDKGLIVPIGRRLVLLAREGSRRLGLPVAVNFAARQLAEPLFLEHLRLDWGDDDWELLTLEITESALLEDLTHVLASLTAVRALGARVSIDDFGTGYSSFARLATLPVDVLKIDQAFVRDLDRPGGTAVVRAIVTLAQAYGLDIIAEGVERVDQLETLVDLGVPKLQGYLLGRPSISAPRPVDLVATGTPARRPPVGVRRAASV